MDPNENMVVPYFLYYKTLLNNEYQKVLRSNQKILFIIGPKEMRLGQNNLNISISS